VGSIGQFINETGRRRVLPTVALYIVAAWVTIQVADMAIDAGILRWQLRDVFVAAFVGFPVALILSWFYDVSRQGLKRTPPRDADAGFDRSLRRRDYLLIGSLAAAWVVAVLIIHTPAPVDKSIAILPFENRGHDPQGADLAFGVRLDLHTQLEKLQDIKIIARESADTIDRDLPVPEIARTLGVAFIMKGTVERILDRVRVSVSLIDAQSGQAWSFVYDDELDVASLFDIRDQIAGQITTSLRAELTPQETQRIKTRPTEDFAAYQAYLLGKKRMELRSTESLADAVEYFLQAVELDPQFALAWTNLAYSHYLHMQYANLPELEAYTRMEAALDRAFELDDQLGEAYAVLSILQYLHYADGAAGISSLERALELNPNDASAHLWYGGRLIGKGRVDEGLAHQERALELDPLSPVVNLNFGMSLRDLGRFDEAMALFETAVRSEEGFPGAYERIGELQRFVYGRFDEAVVWQRKGIALDPAEPMGSLFLGLIYLDLGDPDEAERWFARMQQLVPPGFPLTNMVMEPLYIASGEDDKALAIALATLEASPAERYTLGHVRSHDVREGRYAEALARYRNAYPNLLDDADPQISGGNYEVAIDLALVLKKTGEQERADMLLERSLGYIRTQSRLGISGYGIKDVLIYALQGKEDAALTALRQAIDTGWRTSWWFYLEHDANLDSIREEPEFQAMLEEVKADMAAQLERVRAMEANGELAAIPEME
jgi:TolB-like protein/Tfp pilus assembly protein PilF